MKQLTPTRPDVLFRLEAFCLVLVCCGAYHLLYHEHWGRFAYLFLIPDVSLMAYLKGTSGWATNTYNAAHTYAVPLLLGLFAFWHHREFAGEMSLIWAAHIGMDRMLGYGLKYAGSFKITHVQTASAVSEA